MKTLIKILLVFILLGTCSQNDSCAQDTIYSAIQVKHKFSPDPLKATMLAVALPGMGQIYNRKYWKIPLVYAGFGSMVYFIGLNSSRYSTHMKAYQDFTDDIPQTNSFMNIKGFESIPPEAYDRINNLQGYQHYKEQFIRLIDYYKRYRDLSYIGLGFWYIASIIDANVDASLFNYDVSNNLDITVMPLQTSLHSNLPGAGLNVSLMFNF